MKQFTCTEETLKFAHPETGALVVMGKDDKLTFSDGHVEMLCGEGWGTAEGVETGERKAGVTEMVLKNTQGA